MENKLGSNGFGDVRPINQKEFMLCKKWITKWISPIKTINERAGSYRLKHVVEKNSGTYVSNGVFIKAALNLGYIYKKHGELNAFFNMSFKNAKINKQLSSFDILR